MLKSSFLFLLIILLCTDFGRAQERSITVGELKVWTYASGLADRQPDQPVVVFESGHGTPMGNWQKVLPSLAEMAPIFTYDRPGIGESPPHDYQPTAENVAHNLVKILEAADIDPPYVLVGHSLGGAYVRGFANHYPELLSGLVIIDPADFTERLDDRPAYYAGLGLPDNAVDSLINFFVERRDRRHADSPESIRREGQVLEAMRRNNFATLNAIPLPNIP
ncbi:MAG: alpha/beta hydrolase, partial [Bacteroidota bacterium]